MTTRRGFLKAILALGVAPAIVKAENLMPIYVPKKQPILLFGSGDINVTSWLKPKPGDWFHVSITREANNSKFFLDGLPIQYGELENKDLDILKISQDLIDTNGFHTGYTGLIYNLKVVNGVAMIPSNLII